MRAVYLVRHGEPEYPGGKPVCLGRLNVPLSPAGWHHARALGEYFQALTPLSVVTSPLDRCVQTASTLPGRPGICGGLAEVDMGAWTGLTFPEIRARWPEIYEKRGVDPLGVAPPEGETLAQCRNRVVGAFRETLETLPRGDVIVVAHSSVNRMLTAALTESPELPEPSPLGGVAQLLLENGKAIAMRRAAVPGELPPPVPEAADCLALLREFGTPAKVIAHGEAAAAVAMEICQRLEKRGIRLNERLVFSGALLHDLAKTEPHHARAGAVWLTERGYASVAAVVGTHMRLDDEDQGRWSEKAVVFLADKLVMETRRVTLEERFSSSLGSEKQPYAAIRYRQAKTLLEMLEAETTAAASDAAHT